MEKIISVSFGEIFLKGKNRNKFVQLLKNNIIDATKNLEIIDNYMDHGKFFVQTSEADFEKTMERISRVFGVYSISPTLRTSKDMEDIKAGVLDYMENYKEAAGTFKINTKRADKSFPIKSPDLNQIFGGLVLKNIDNIKVDVHNPDLELKVDIRRDHAYISGRTLKAAGGLPVGSSGRGVCLLSGGIDSPVAAYMIGKRGVEVDMVHFNSYPFTSDRSFEKVKSLSEIVGEYLGPHKFYNVNLLNIQKAIGASCQERNMTILSRRFMMRIADKIAESNGGKMLITGESLGQVASQTIEGLTATDAVTKNLVMRPLIGMDKEEIIKIAKDIGTYETSILPYEDCCTVFQPKNPNIKPKLEELAKEEEALDVEGMVEEAINSMEVIEIDED